MNGIRWPVEEKEPCDECGGTGIIDILRTQDEHGRWHTTNVLCNHCQGNGYTIVETYPDDINEELLWDENPLD